MNGQKLFDQGSIRFLAETGTEDALGTGTLNSHEKDSSMPMLTDLRRRLLAAPQPEQDSALDGEVLVADTRSQLSPSQQVEQKLREFLISRTFTANDITRQRPKPR